MSLSEQSAILVEALEQGFLRPEDIIRWADNVLITMDQPPTWVIEISTSGSPYLVDFITQLREHATPSLALRFRIQIVVLAHLAGLLSLNAVLQKLFILIIINDANLQTDELDERLAECLVDWDCQEDSDIIGPTFKAKLNALFQVYLSSAGEIAAVLPWRFAKVG